MNERHSGKIKVLIVDDSAVFSEFLRKELTEQGFEIVGTAMDPYEARDKILALDPDVLTLDIEMPRMDGIKFLTRLIPQYPIPCIVVSSLEDKKKDAIASGAADFCLKPDPSKGRTGSFIPELSDSIRRYAGKRVSIPSANRPAQSYVWKPTGTSVQQPVHKPVLTAFSSGKIFSQNGVEIIALGASTGGTDALQTVIMGLPGDCPPVIITQHMPPVFTQMYAERLDRISPMKVSEAAEGMRLEKGTCVVAAGGKQMRLMKDSEGYYITSRAGEKVSGHCPSVDVMFDSAADAAGGRVVAALLTGMGADGAAGLLKLRKCGAYTIGQNKETCVVYGMPMEAYKLGAVCEEAPLDCISGIIMKRLGRI